MCSKFRKMAYTMVRRRKGSTPPKKINLQHLLTGIHSVPSPVLCRLATVASFLLPTSRIPEGFRHRCSMTSLLGVASTEPTDHCRSVLDCIRQCYRYKIQLLLDKMLPIRNVSTHVDRDNDELYKDSRVCTKFGSKSYFITSVYQTRSFELTLVRRRGRFVYNHLWFIYIGKWMNFSRRLGY